MRVEVSSVALPDYDGVTLHMLLAQYEPEGQPPQSSNPPQPSLAAPHCTCCAAHVSLLQPAVPVPH